MGTRTNKTSSKTTKKKATKKATPAKKQTKKAGPKKATKSTSQARVAKQKAFKKKAGQAPRRKPLALEVDPDVLEFIDAIERFKKSHARPFPSWSEILYVVRDLGYSKR